MAESVFALSARFTRWSDFLAPQALASRGVETVMTLIRNSVGQGEGLQMPSERSDQVLFFIHFPVYPQPNDVSFRYFLNALNFVFFFSSFSILFLPRPKRIFCFIPVPYVQHQYLTPPRIPCIYILAVPPHFFLQAVMLSRYGRIPGGVQRDEGPLRCVPGPSGTDR